MDGSFGTTVDDLPHAAISFNYQVEAKISLPTLKDLENLVDKIEVKVSEMLVRAFFNDCHLTGRGRARRDKQQVRANPLSTHAAYHRLLSLQGISPFPADIIQGGGMQI